VLVLMPVILNAQFSTEEQKYIDSLSVVVESNTVTDLSLAEAYINLSNILFLVDIDTVIYLCNAAVEISKRNLNKPGLDSVSKTKYELLLSSAYNNLGYAYEETGRIDQALDYYFRSLKISEKLGDKSSVAESLNNIGYTFIEQGTVDEGLAYYLKALEIFKELGDQNRLSSVYISLGYAYKASGNLKRSEEYYLQALELKEDLKDKRGVAKCLNNIASVDIAQNDFSKASALLRKALYISREIDYTAGVYLASKNLATIKIRLLQLDSALIMANTSFKAAEKLGSHSYKSEAYEMLYEILKLKNLPEEALEMYEFHIEMRDSIKNEATIKATIRQQTRYQYEKKKVIDDAENDKLVAIEKKEKEKQTIISYSTAVGLILVVMFLLFVFNRLKITRKQKIVIEDQKKDIVDSINYAKRIQDAILPTQEMMKMLLPNSFIFYKPKDIVAGDFYWIDQQNENITFAAADCTGHGVPGAMISVVCHNALNRVVREHHLTSPGDILDKTREIVTEQLSKSDVIDIESMKNIRDGMDIALCSLNIRTKELQYAGAQNPLWILRNGATEIEEIKATKQSIGKISNPKPYKSHNVNLNKGDSVYIFSDGFADQFGGIKGKKMMYKPFKKLLISMGNESMDNQLTALNKHFESWKGKLEQIDDVCVMGVRV
jgi:serine phosphatase RsbU (regulator of sigma subunit)/tetratricopeptide (TPR) repeat protein